MNAVNCSFAGRSVAFNKCYGALKITIVGFKLNLQKHLNLLKDKLVTVVFMTTFQKVKLNPELIIMDIFQSLHLVK